MAGPPRIAVVYKDRSPRLIEEEIPAGLFLEFEFFEECEILGAAVKPLRNYIAVFYPIQNALPEIERCLSNIFPGAEIVGYSNRDKDQAGALTKSEDGSLVIRIPMQLQLARYLLESFAAAQAQRRELTRVQRRADNVQELFESFVDAVESASTIADRKIGMDLLINKILSHVQAEECVLYLLNKGNAGLQRAYSTGNIKDIDLFEQHANTSIVEKVLTGGLRYLNNNYSFELQVPFSKESVFIRSVICYPLVRGEDKIGVLELINKADGAFNREDQDLIETMLGPLAVAIRTVDMFEESERLTITDDLTQLYNYRYLKRYLEADVKRCLRYKKKVSLLFIDIDGFKRINDTFGHLVGSQALSEMGQVLKGMVRETDVVTRYGGDEFVIVLPETPLNGAMVIAERIRKKVEECEFIAQNLSIRLTVSVGVASCPKHTLTAEGLIKKADAAMYRAKELSKNSIKVAV